MFKIKLLILLLAISIFSACGNKNSLYLKDEYSLAYVGGDYDGLYLSNYLQSLLISNNLYDQDSTYEINPSIGHERELYITNIDNTSGRERVTTTLNIKIKNIKQECYIHSFSKSISQFYLLSPSNKYLSNEAAVESIKKNNVKDLSRAFINQINQIPKKCLPKTKK